MCNDLSWTGSSGITGSPAVSFNVYRSSTSPVPIDAGSLVTIGITETNYTDCGNVYNRYCVVTAANGNGESDPSNEDRASEPCGFALVITLPVLNATALTESGEDPVVTKYYFHGGKRVALNRDGVVQWLVGDHLGTTSLVLDDQGGKVAESRHYPYGEERWSSGTLPTDYRFTGQRMQSGLRLYHMGARHYDPALGRWISADTLVPEPGSSQSYNRYAYVRNSPLVYVDPTGHRDCEYSEGEWVIPRLLSQYAGEWADGWSADDTWAVVQAFGMIAGAETIGVIVIDVAVIAVDAAIAATTAACADGDCRNELEQLLRLREEYEREVLALAEQGRQRLANGQSVEEVARWAHGERRALGDLYKSMTPPDLLNEIYARNLEIYGDPLGPTIEWLLERGKTWEGIIESATRPGGQDIIQKLLGH